MNEQQQNLKRVERNIDGFVLDFLRDHVSILTPPLFFLSELTRYVSGKTAIAPDSASRVLRSLRSRGKIGYVVVNRARSLYELKFVQGGY